ncbi:MAG: hypothetical protein KAH31_06455, partial [Candidatus Sabulitectum sp.]|nr:hypothetical protein [Candidatus Sabulitectum sp.]
KLKDGITMDYKKLAQASGCVIFERSNKIYVMEQSKKWIATFRYVLALITLIISANAIYTLISGWMNQGSLPTFGIIFAAVGVFLGLILFLIHRVKMKADNLSPDELNTFCILDTEAGNLLGPQNTILTPLSAVKFTKIFSFTSSSPDLSLSWPDGKIVIARGNIFAGGIKPVVDVLNRYLVNPM